MNPFEEVETKIEDVQYKIDISVSRRGRQQITFIDGWNLPENELKEHVSKIKKTIASSGCIKKEDNIVQVQFQGNHVEFLMEYLITSGIDKKSIYIKG